MSCKYCGSEKVVKHGKVGDKQRYLCKVCGHKYVETLSPQSLGIYHVDETAIKCKGVQKWFWEIIDEQTKFLIASHLSGSRTTEDVVQLFEESVRVAKREPTSIYCDV